MSDEQTPPPRLEPPLQCALILPNPGSHKKPTWLSILENSLELIKVLAWPALILTVLSLFYVPVRDTVEQLPIIVSQAQKISVGSLSVEVQAQARQIGGAELASALLGLSSAAIEKLLLTGKQYVQIMGTNNNDPTRFSLPNEKAMKAIRELESKRLLTLDLDRENPVHTLEEFESELKTLHAIPDYADEDHQSFSLKSGNVDSIPLLKTEYKLTPLGLAAFESVVNAVSHQLATGFQKDAPTASSEEEKSPKKAIGKSKRE